MDIRGMVTDRALGVAGFSMRGCSCSYREARPTGTRWSRRSGRISVSTFPMLGPSTEHYAARNPKGCSPRLGRRVRRDPGACTRSHRQVERFSRSGCRV